ncbi:MAG: 30S ribosome-binding factor RbfA [Bryobacteraceae bacterium]
MDPHRAGRVAESLKEELAEIIGYEMSDPRLGSVAVIDVQVSRDLRHARVRVAVGGDVRRQEDALKALEGARHYIRREAASRLRLWRIPELHFEHDTAPDSASRIEELLKRVQKSRTRAEDSSN